MLSRRIIDTATRTAGTQLPTYAGEVSPAAASSKRAYTFTINEIRLALVRGYVEFQRHVGDLCAADVDLDIPGH